MPVRWPVAPTPAMPTDALSGLAFSQRDQPLQIVGRQALLADDQQRLAADLDDRLEILQQIELQRVEAAGQHVRGRGADAQRVAVGGRAHGAADAEAAGGASDILDHHGLAENRPHLLGQKARQRVGGPAGRERHDHGDRTRRIVLGRGDAGRRQDRAGSRPKSSAIYACSPPLRSPASGCSPQSVPAALGRAVLAPLDKPPNALHNPVTLPVVCQLMLLRS